ncbi:ADP-ribosylglycohydrolase family protein [Cytobacillus sp. Hz8]|uniref:ADP-ribosylglycohydrolase family protein n=1 Tax=Cytobacillus sp. Hz8 TaxID=3347168 RepID=UPI0035E101AB
MLDKIKGGLFGVAIGDALGGTTEFMTEEEIKKEYGCLTEMLGGGVWNLAPGEVTDDTAMTIAVCKGIISNPIDPISEIGNEFLHWYDTKPKDIGNTIREVLRQYNGDWFQTSKNVNIQLNGMSAGNGTLMRTLPVALSYPSLPKIDEITNLQSKMTHYDDETSSICQLYNKIAFQLLNQYPLKDAIETVIRDTKFFTIFKKKPSVPSDGYVVNTFYWVLYYLYHLDDFREIAIAAANNGGDSDTIAAIACGLKGVEIGYERLPDDYKHKIILKEELSQLSMQLHLIREHFRKSKIKEDKYE